MQVSEGADLRGEGTRQPIVTGISVVRSREGRQNGIERVGCWDGCGNENKNRNDMQVKIRGGVICLLALCSDA